MTMMDAALSLLSDRAVQTYFLVLGLAVHRCIKIYYSHHPEHQPQQQSAAIKSSSSSGSGNVKGGCREGLDQKHHNHPSFIPILLSALTISITWFLILRFILQNLHTSTSYFDDAYKDVLRSGHYFTSTQLLTWAIVAVVWATNEGCHVAFLVFGFLGAMSAAFVIWVPMLYRGREHALKGTTSRMRKKAAKRGHGSSDGTGGIPITYILSSSIAFLCILKLQPCIPSPTSIQEAYEEECTPEEGFGTFTPNFRHWLQCLHVILVLPIFLPYLVPKVGILGSFPCSIHPALVFGTLSLLCFTWHIYQILVQGRNYVVPVTDCQLSITTDLVCCSCISLYAMYKDSVLWLSSRNGSGSIRENVKKNAVDDDGRDRTSSSAVIAADALRNTCLAAIIMPLLSPAGVLAGHLCLKHLDDFHALLIAHCQRRVAERLASRDNAAKNKEKGKDEGGDDGVARMRWCNLGLWTSPSDDDGKNVCSYNQACKNLANALGKMASLDSTNALLCCGCGPSLDEVRYYKRTFQLRHVTGIDPHLGEERMVDEEDYNVRAICAGVEDLACATTDEQLPRNLFPPRIFDRILALDNVYHYPSKEDFLRDCLAMLPEGGKVAVSDIVLKTHSSETPVWVKIAFRAMGIPSCNLWSVHEYKSKLEMLGYVSKDIKMQLVGEQVFKGWKQYLPKSLLQHLDYALIVAKKPIVENQPMKSKQRVAIIGSGLAGLSTAHTILTSQQAANIDVDIYESNFCPGLAGHTTLVGGQLVDVPARMACLGYYDRYSKLLEELDVPSAVVRTDSSFYGDDGRGGGRVCYCYDQRSWVNLYNAVFVGGLGKLWQLVYALSKITTTSCNGNDKESQEQTTFGEWLQANLNVPINSAEEKEDLPAITCRSNPFAYIMCGSLSWMLSCTWESLLKYPADIVLPYCRGLRMDRLGVGRDGQVIRIVPSIKVLERTLLYGVRKLHLNTRVAAIDASKTINGVTYDAAIVATDAKSVPKVLKHCPTDVFSKFAYHPSTIYIHTDERFMPPNKKDWKCWNVEMSSGRQEPQLTFWLNEFYPDAKFKENVFQTWAPIHAPQKETIIRRSDFERVVHSKDTRSYISDIQEAQGKDGIYYAGSYCVYGMGLLEQALRSGEDVASKVLDDLNTTNPTTSTDTTTKKTAPAAPALKALVIGAGPSGLVTAKYLLESNEPTYDVTIVDSLPAIGGTFRNKVYDNCRLVSSKYLTAFSDWRMPEDTTICPDHPSTEQYVDYLESYADQFCLRKHIKFGHTVISVNDAINANSAKGLDCNGYEVQFKTPSNDSIITKEFDVVAVCSGLHNTPYIPKLFIPSSPDTKNGITHKFKGQIIHSSQYKDPSIFANKRVLILGCGETAMDIAHRAISQPETKSVALSVRRGFLSIPHNLAKDRPLDVFITNLFEHAYEHPWIHALRLRWVLSTFFIRIFLFFTGSSWGFNQWAVPTTPVARGYHIINKSHAAMSNLNVPMKSQSAWGRFWLWVYGETSLRPIQSFHGTEVTDVEEDGVTMRFGDGRTFEADLIILATGYKQSFPFLDEKIRNEMQEESLQANGNDFKMDTSRYHIKEDYLPSEHFIVSKTRPRLGFIGFVRPNVGAIPPMSELQVMWWLEKMQGRVNALAKSSGGPPSYMVLGRKYAYGVDYGNYMHRLSEDIDSAPTLSILANSRHPFKALYTYCIGQSMISLFRLQGPYESKLCWEIVTEELWRVCLKRGLAENCGLLFMTWLSLLMNVGACVLECIMCIFTFSRPKFFVRY